MHIFKKFARAILILVILLGLAGGVIWVVQSTGPKFSTIPNPSKAEIVVSPEIVSIQSPMSVYLVVGWQKGLKIA